MNDHIITQEILRTLAKLQREKKTILLPEPIVNEIIGKEEDKSMFFKDIELSKVIQYAADLM